MRQHRNCTWSVQSYSLGDASVHPYLTHASLDHPSPQPKRHLDRFSGFSRAHDRDRPTHRQTDRQTDRPRYSVCNIRPHLRRDTAMRHKKFVSVELIVPNTLHILRRLYTQVLLFCIRYVLFSVIIWRAKILSMP